MQNKILIVEDEQVIREGILDALNAQGFEAMGAERGDEALAKTIIMKPDLIILDVMLPKLNGFDVCLNLRENGIQAPIIFLSAKGGENDRVKGLEMGADDYMTKPFSVKELIARVHAHLRRRVVTTEPGSFSHSGPIRVGNLTIDFEARSCKLNDQPKHLSEKEFLILKFLIDNVGKVVDREELLREVWGYKDIRMETRTVDVTIGKMRQKIEQDNQPKIVQTRHGKGYIIENVG